MKIIHRFARAVAARAALVPSEAATQDYYDDAAVSLRGSAEPRVRLHGVEALRAHVRGRSVLDLGCAEGLVLRELAKEALAFGHGVDNSPRRIDSATRLAADARLRFDVVDLNDPRNVGRAPLRPGYDVIMLLGVYQHLWARTRREVLGRALSTCRELAVLRVPSKLREEALAVFDAAGFGLVQKLAHPGISPLLLFRRRAA